jgi:PAS domain S-box-containing protein
MTLPRLADVDILVVDDRPQDLLAIEAILSTGDYSVSTATTSSSAVRKLLERDFAVIVLDVMMPDLDGFELATIIKQRERSRHTPIIFMTSAGEDMSFIYRAYSVGAVDYLTKPVDPDVLKAKVAIYVELFRKDCRITCQALELRAADRRQREHEAAALVISTERRYRNLADAIPQIVWAADASGAIRYFNQRFHEYSGMASADVLGRSWPIVVHPDDQERVDARWAASIADGAVLEVECRLRRADGAYRWHLCRAVPERGDDHRISGWIGTNTDVDDRRRALDAAHEAVAVRDEFLSIASHELRTPLTVLELRLDTLEANLADVFDGGRDDLRRKMTSARRSSQRLVRLVDSLFDVTRLANGDLTLERETYDLGDSVREGSAGFAEMAHGAGCEVAISTDGDLVVSWDRLRIEQVVHNLLGNAIKYAPKAPIEIELSAQLDVVTISIRDHGMGMAPADVERVFGRFERAVSARHFGGLGMGLYIARKIAAAHGGTIRATSTPGDGSTFVVQLPRAGGAAPGP